MLLKKRKLIHGMAMGEAYITEAVPSGRPAHQTNVLQDAGNRVLRRLLGHVSVLVNRVSDGDGAHDPCIWQPQALAMI